MSYKIVVFMSNEKEYLILKDCIKTLEEAKELRVASGDIVLDNNTKRIVTDTAWLWDWEKEDPKSYAMKKIAQNPLVIEPWRKGIN